MPTEIDSLQIQISADASIAEKSLNRLAESLTKLSGSISGINTGSFSQLAGGVSQLAAAMQQFSSNVKTLNFTQIANGLNKLSDIKTQEVNNASKVIDTLGKSLHTLSNVTFDAQGINEIVNAISKLSDIKIEDTEIVAKAVNNISNAFRNMVGISIPNLEGVDSLIANIRKFGSNSAVTASQTLPFISESLVSFVSSLNDIGALTFDFTGVSLLVQSISRLGGTKAVAAAENLPFISEYLVGMIRELNKIEAINFDLTGLSELVSSISKLGSKSATTAASGNIVNLANALRQMMSILSGAPQVSQNLIQMTQALAQLAATGNTAGTATNTLSRSFSSLPASTTKARKSMFSLASAFGRFYATYWLLLRALGQFKKAIDISSDLTEVQNVVDKTFGDMAYKVEELSDTSIQDFGMSELTVKQISSRFQAMGTAMGFAQGQMSDMSVELTKLAADMASFYNVEQADVAEDLEAIFTGQTRPLRTYGLDLTQATLQEWALKQGIDANVQSMSQMEKTMLRYQYVMAQTSAVQGDFSQTSGRLCAA